jgi:hypothetical protein
MSNLNCFRTFECQDSLAFAPGLEDLNPSSLFTNGAFGIDSKNERPYDEAVSYAHASVSDTD